MARQAQISAKMAGELEQAAAKLEQEHGLSATTLADIILIRAGDKAARKRVIVRTDDGELVPFHKGQ